MDLSSSIIPEIEQKHLRALREEVKEDNVLEDADLPYLIRAMINGNKDVIRAELEEAIFEFNGRHSGIYDKAAVVGAGIGKILINAGKSS